MKCLWIYVQDIFGVVKALISMRMSRIRLYLLDRRIYVAYRDFTEPIFIENPSKVMSDFETECYATITAEIARMRECGIKDRYLKERLRHVAEQTDDLQARMQKVVKMSKCVTI